MKSTLFVIFAVGAFNLVAQSPNQIPTIQPPDVMVVGVAHDASVMGGGIGSSSFLAPGKAVVEPIAWLSGSGDWNKIHCDESHPSECKKFDRDYLSKTHDYTVVSSDGNGSKVHVKKMTLDDECFGIGGDGTFDGGPIRYAAVAAESPDIFTTGPAARRLPESEAEPVRRGLAAAVGNKLDTTKELRVYSVVLENQSLLIIQRAFQDYADKPEYRPPDGPNLDLIFAIGLMDRGRFKLLFWKENTGDDNEQILGVVHLKNGRDFLVNAASDPESNHFRIYGIRNGKLALVFEGSGGSC